MSDFQSYSTYVPPEQHESNSVARSNPIQVLGSTHQTSIENGVITAGSAQKHHKIDSNNMSPFEESDWRRTAMKQSGSPAQEITEDTLVTLHGQQGRVKDFVRAGVLNATTDGFELASESVSDAPQDNPDASSMPEEFAKGVDDALAPFNQHTLDSGLALTISAISSGSSLDSVVQNIVRKSGLEPSDATQRVEFTVKAYEMQTASYLKKQGITSEDLPAFIEFCQQAPQDYLQVLQKQMYSQDMSGWKGLVSKYMSSTAPSVEILNQHGFDTRNLRGQPEVLIDGVWMTIATAAKSGLI